MCIKSNEMLNICHKNCTEKRSQNYSNFLKHNTKEIEALLLKDQQQKHNALKLLAPQVTETLS